MNQYQKLSLKYKLRRNTRKFLRSLLHSWWLWLMLLTAALYYAMFSQMHIPAPGGYNPPPWLPSWR